MNHVVNAWNCGKTYEIKASNQNINWAPPQSGEARFIRTCNGRQAGRLDRLSVIVGQEPVAGWAGLSILIASLDFPVLMPLQFS